MKCLSCSQPAKPGRRRCERHLDLNVVAAKIYHSKNREKHLDYLKRRRERLWGDGPGCSGCARFVAQPKPTCALEPKRGNLRSFPFRRERACFVGTPIAGVKQ